MYYRQVKPLEYFVLTNIHLLAFNDFFLTTLGKSFLNAYYKSCLKSKESINVCVENEQGKIVGFGLGCINSKGFHKRLIKQNLITFIIQGIIILFSKPKDLFRLASNLEKTAYKDDDGNYCDLLSIAVLPDYNGLGIGKELIKRFEEEAIKKGCKKISLTTDFENNESVIEFYKKSGYKIFYTFKSYPNRFMYKMIKDI